MVFLKITELRLSFDTDIALLFLVVFALLAIAGSILVYFKNRENSEFTLLQTRVLSVLRAAGIFLCLFLLLKPVLVSKKQIKEKPVIVLATDNSQSLRKLETQVSESAELIKKKLADKFEIDSWIFGEEPAASDSINFVGTKSDYSELLSTVSNQYINKNVGALVIIGDGIYNAGQNPLNQISSINFPIYTVGFGDTLNIPDIRISEVKHNPSVFINNYFSIETDIHFEMLANQTARIELSNGNKIIGSRSIAIPTNTYFATETFRIQATKKGLQNYRIKVIPLEQETNKVNNSKELIIEVIDSKHKILVLSDGPHPDIGSIKDILESFSNFEITLVNGNTVPENIDTYDLFVLYQLPSTINFNNKALLSMIHSKKPLLVVVGEKTSLPYLNNLQLGVSSMSATGLNESQIDINNDFSLFKLENEYAENLESFPPLYVPYTTFSVSSELQTLGYQKIKGINTGNPLLAMGKTNDRKIGFLLGEGIWRWRIFDFRMNHQYKTINELVYKIFNYLCIKENEENFKLNFSPAYSENEDVIVGAELYNDSYELVNSPEATLLLKKDSITEFHFIFDKIDNQYLLNLGKPGTGIYQIEASVKLGEKEYRKSGNFSLVSLNLEEQQTVANHHILYQLAYETGGSFFTPENLNKLFTEIESNEKIKPDKFVHFTQNELLNSKWLFAMIVLIFSLEWFLRKYWGIY